MYTARLVSKDRYLDYGSAIWEGDSCTAGRFACRFPPSRPKSLSEFNVQLGSS